LGGLDKSPNGVVIGRVQLPVVATKADLARQALDPAAPRSGGLR
jgi:hypothetical protein